MNAKLWKKYEDNLLNEGKTKKRIDKLKFMFDTCDKAFNKPFDKVTRADVEDFVNKLHRNQLRTKRGAPYSGNTKSDLKKFLKQFWKWFKGQGEDYPDAVRWIKTNVAKDEKPEEKDTVTLEEAVKLARAFNKIEYRIMTLILFDSGFRIDELLSCKKKDLTFEDFDAGKKCFWIKCNRSKTLTRKVPVPLFTEELNVFVNSASFQTQPNDEPLFGNVAYFAYNKALKATSERVLKKRLSPHHLRHSSATHYAKEFDGNMMMIADRYGWSYTSDELKLYIRRSGAYQRQGVKKAYENEVLKLKAELSDMRERMANIERLLGTKYPKAKKAAEIYREKKKKG